MTNTGRFAPSPTGDFHLGNLRTAILAWAWARVSGRRFVLRIEDIDRARAGSADRQIADLEAIGIDWDGDPLVQTTRADAHEAALEELAARGLLFECYCSRRDIREAASILCGVTAIEAENVMAALIAKKSIRREDMDEVRTAKDRLFSDISGLEKITVDESVRDVGGLTGLRNWLDEKRLLFTAEKRSLLREKGLKSPRGILLVGVPGCGKSLSAKAISASWKLPLYRLDFATVQGSYVGQTEQQLQSALQTAENVAPCILWIDEIEKGLSGAGSSNDGGVSTRMVGQFLFWLQECRKPVFVVATANDVSMLPSELLRRGRFDELFFIDLPTADERRDILHLYMRKYLGLDFAGAFADTLVAMTDGFTGADLESTVRDLAYRAIANPAFSLSAENLRSAFENVVPLSATAPEKIAAIRDWGRERAVPASGRPIGSETELKKSAEMRTRKVLV